MSKKIFDRTSLDFRLPGSWGELTGKEVEIVCRIYADPHIEAGELPLTAALRLSGISVLGRSGKGFICRDSSGHLSMMDKFGALSLVKRMSWVCEPPKELWSPGRIADADCLDLDEDLSFGDWLAIEDRMLGVPFTHDMTMLDDVARIIIPGHGRLEEWHRIALFMWLQSFKADVEMLYPDYFSSSAPIDETAGLQARMRANVNAQIRALTKGDITKEETVLAMPCHRAFAELDAQAREYEELRRLSKK